MTTTKNTEMQRKNQNTDVEEFHGEATMAPAVDVYEGANETWIVADLPGVKKDDVAIEIEGGELRFHAKATPFLASDADFRWTRAFRIPPGIDGDKVTADLRDGVLTLKLPKPAELKPRKIEVRASRTSRPTRRWRALPRGRSSSWPHGRTRTRAPAGRRRGRARRRT